MNGRSPDFFRKEFDPCIYGLDAICNIASLDFTRSVPSQLLSSVGYGSSKHSTPVYAKKAVVLFIFFMGYLIDPRGLIVVLVQGRRRALLQHAPSCCYSVGGPKLPHCGSTDTSNSGGFSHCR